MIMLASQRERAILQLLQETGSARIEALAARLGVTDETVRRNVRRLQEQGMVTRVHGGVHLKNPGAKRRIAEGVARLLPDGASLFLDVGSTTAYVAQALRARRELLVVTNSLAVAQALTGVNGNQVFMAGGELRSHDGGAFGAEALAFVKQFRVSYAVLSVAAISAPSGFLLQDLREAEFSRAIIERAEQAIVAADASKFGRSAPIAIAEPGRFSQLVTDAAPDAGLAGFLAGHGVRVVLA
jgi:DeoR family glycerol-3-phosphate regulon repressor